MKIKDVDDLDEYLPANVPCKNAYALQKLAHLGPAVCSRHINRTDRGGRAHERTNNYAHN